jgi:transposase-like protein
MTHHHPPAARQAAIEDYYASGDAAKDVAERHGIPRSTFAGWIGNEREHAYEGGWEVRGGVSYPLLPERRSA